MDGEIEYNKKLSDGDTYTLDCRGKASGSSKDGYEYTVYDDLYQEWALEPVVPADPTDGPTPIEDTGESGTPASAPISGSMDTLPTRSA